MQGINHIPLDELCNPFVLIVTSSWGVFNRQFTLIFLSSCSPCSFTYLCTRCLSSTSISACFLLEDEDEDLNLCLKGGWCVGEVQGRVEGVGGWATNIVLVADSHFLSLASYINLFYSFFCCLFTTTSTTTSCQWHSPSWWITIESPLYSSPTDTLFSHSFGLLSLLISLSSPFLFFYKFEICTLIVNRVKITLWLQHSESFFLSLVYIYVLCVADVHSWRYKHPLSRQRSITHPTSPVLFLLLLLLLLL